MQNFLGHFKLQSDIAHLTLAPSLQPLTEPLQLHEDTLNRAGGGNRGIPVLADRLHKTRQFGPETFKVEPPLLMSLSFKAENEGAVIRNSRGGTLQERVQRHFFPLGAAKKPVKPYKGWRGSFI